MQHSKSTYVRGNPEYPGLSWTALQSILERAEFDQLLLFDCCYAAAALAKGFSEYTMEFLTACGREITCAGPKWTPYIGSAFTQTLIKYLKQGAHQPKGLLVTELHTFLSLDKNLDNQSPNHAFIYSHRRSLMLKSLKGAMGQVKNTQIEKPLKELGCHLTALVAISFLGDAPMNAELMAKWLAYQVPDDVGNIKVEAVYESRSTAMLVVMPLWLWACLPDIPGCSLVEFVESGNLIDLHPSLKKFLS